MKRLQLTALALMMQIATSSMAAEPPASAASSQQLAAPGTGLDAASFDASVRAQDDLFRATNGAWLKRTEIPADKASYGTFIQLRDLSDERVRTIIEELSKTQAKAGLEQKIGSFYTSFEDTKAIDKLGLKPIQPMLKEIDAISNPHELAVWLGAHQGQVNTPVLLDVTTDAKQPNVNRVVTWQGGLGLPDRDYYLLKDDARMAKAREAYLHYLTQLAGFAKEKQPAKAAARVMALEQQLAQVHWDKVENRDPVKTYNLESTAELAAQAPGFDWTAFLQAAQLGAVTQLSVSQPSANTGIAKLLAEQPLQDWKLFLKLHSIDAYAAELPKAVRDASFAFHGAALTGAKQEKARWQQGTDRVNGALGEAVGQLYVARYFPPAYKARMQALVGNLMAAYKESIDGLSWMSPATKLQAQDKLSKYMTKIGYPDNWRDFSKLEVKAGDALGNQQRSEQFEWARTAAKAAKPVDRTEWGMTPQTVNAYYNPSLNEIVFPAAILQPPFFDMNADDAVNYGGIGAVIGHEISHGFDDQGSQFDGDGALRVWWTDADREAFNKLTNALVAQYAAYEPLPEHHVNGQLTLGENIADLSGLQIAYKAYKRSLNGQPAPVIGGLTGDQRFFMGWAQVWREKSREERRLQLITVDPHSPSEFRANGAAVNHDGFHEAFGTHEGDKMYKAPEQRIRIW